VADQANSAGFLGALEMSTYLLGESLQSVIYRHNKTFPLEQVLLADVDVFENCQVRCFDILNLLKYSRTKRLHTNRRDNKAKLHLTRFVVNPLYNQQVAQQIPPQKKSKVDTKSSATCATRKLKRLCDQNACQCAVENDTVMNFIPIYE